MGNSLKKKNKKTGWLRSLDSKDLKVFEKSSEYCQIEFANPLACHRNEEAEEYVGPPVDITVNVIEGPGLWQFLDVFSKPRTIDAAPVRGLVLDVVEKEYGGGAKKLPSDILDAFFTMLSDPNSQSMELVHLTVQNIFCRKSMNALATAVEVMANLNSVELFSNGLKDGDVEHFMMSCAKNSSLKKIMVSGQALTAPARDAIEKSVKNIRPDIHIELFS